mmetsp:Transcript_4850/g.14112  ORF Transcript_4850/g.14112 Transcript_4850/m.14112 type:complete len:157 (-) Transcript_4850:83-553(-)
MSEERCGLRPMAQVSVVSGDDLCGWLYCRTTDNYDIIDTRDQAEFTKIRTWLARRASAATVVSEPHGGTPHADDGAACTLPESASDEASEGDEEASACAAQVERRPDSQPEMGRPRLKAVPRSAGAARRAHVGAGGQQIVASCMVGFFQPTVWRVS